MAGRSSAWVLGALRQALSGAAIRASAGIRDMGEVLIAKVGRVLGGDHIDDVGGKDVFVHYEDLMAGTDGGVGGVGRLFFPLNALFGVPARDESATVIRPRDAGGPGVPLVLWGDAGRSLPSWIRSKIGLWNSKPIVVESTGGDVEVNCSTDTSARVRINQGTLRIARQTDQVEIGQLSATAGPYPVVFTWTPFRPDGTPLTTIVSPVIILQGVISSDPAFCSPQATA